LEQLRLRYKEEEKSYSGEIAASDSSLNQLPADHPMDALTELLHAERERTQHTFPEPEYSLENFVDQNGYRNRSRQ